MDIVNWAFDVFRLLRNFGRESEGVYPGPKVSLSSLGPG